MVPIKRHQYAFSLMELSIVLAIMGVLVGGVLSFATKRVEIDKHEKTARNIDIVEQALTAFVKENHRLPCPADGTAALGTAAFGAEIALCNNAPGTRNNLDWQDIGMVPTKALNIPDMYAFDAWGRRLTYFVVSTCTAADDFENPATDSECGGTVDSVKQAFTICSDLNGDGTACETGATITSDALYVIISQGKNGHGGWQYYGNTTRKNAGGTISTEEERNSQYTDVGAEILSNGIFLSRSHILNNAANYFDDIVRFREHWRLLTSAGGMPHTAPLCTLIKEQYKALYYASYDANRGGDPEASTLPCLTVVQSPHNQVLNESEDMANLYCDAATETDDCTSITTGCKCRMSTLISIIRNNCFLRKDDVCL